MPPGKDNFWLKSPDRRARRGTLLLVVPGIGLGLTFWRREAFQALEQLFLGHAVGNDLSVVGIDPSAGRADQLNRLDFLIARLKENGIYADLNLHVSRTHPGMPTWAGGPSYHKGVDNFIPEMIEWQHGYARGLLTHLNP